LFDRPLLAGATSWSSRARRRGVAVVPSRAELIAHWQVVGDLALEYLARRPLTLVRQVSMPGELSAFMPK
jgi:DNA primase